MKLKISIICFLLFVSGALCTLAAGEIENKIDRAKLGMAQSLMNLSDFNEAEIILQDLYKKYPHSSEVASNYVIILARKRDYPKAMEVCRQVLKADAKNKDAGIWLARLLSWNKEYEQAIAVYDEMIKEYPDWIDVRREKARVLGWDRRYDEAIVEYRKALKQIPDNQAVRYEMLSKYNLYNQFDISAEANYKQWLRLEPENLEALYDLGKVYSSQQRWAEAKKMYLLTLEEDKTHLQAKQGLKRAEIYSKSINLQAGFEYFQADSSGRTMDMLYWDNFVSLRKPMSEKIYLKVRQDNIWRSFKNYKQIYQQQFSVGLEYVSKPLFWAAVNYSGSVYPDEKGLKHIFGGQLNFVPKDAWTLNLSHQREQITDNSMVFLNKLYRDNYKIRTEYKPARRFMAGLDYMHSDYSDDNRRDAYGFDLAYYLSIEPKRLKLSYRYEEYGFDREDADYFSPDSFHTNKVGLEWRHFLNKDEIFWGAKDTYYTLAYDVIFDVKQQTGYKIYADFHYDWSDNCSIHLEWSKIIYEHSDVYSENRFMLYTSIYF